MFGFDSQGKEFKTALQAAGADITMVKEWLKTAEKTRKQYENVKEIYDKSRACLLRVAEILQALENFMVSGKIVESYNADFSSLLKELKKLRGTVDHEFLVNAQDREFHLTYDTILKIAPAYLEGKADGIILQSEIENLSSLAKEAIEKERPDLTMLSYFYLRRSDKELCELPHSEKISKIRRIFSAEFLDPMTKEVVNCIDFAQKNPEDKYIGKMAFLLDPSKGTDSQERAQNILKEFYVG